MTKNLVFLAVLAVAACGGKAKNETTESTTPMIDPTASSGDATDHSGMMIPPEKMEEVTRLLDRKRMIVSRCLADAVDAGDAPKGARGKITLAISIAPSGQTSSVEVIKTSIESKEVQACVKRKVEEITFPTMPRQYNTSYTYAMEAI